MRLEERERSKREEEIIIIFEDTPGWTNERCLIHKHFLVPLDPTILSHQLLHNA
jgi:hypothetical protein